VKTRATEWLLGTAGLSASRYWWNLPQNLAYSQMWTTDMWVSMI